MKDAPGDLKTHVVQNREEYLSATLDVVDVSIFCVQADNGKITNCNQRLCTELGTPADQILFRPYTEVFWPDIVRLFRRLMDECSFEKAASGVYYWAERRRWEQVSVRKVQVQGGAGIAVFSVTNITDIGRSEFEYRRRVYYDQKLGVPNGARLEKDVEALESYHDVALVHFDIDSFSTINEVYGWDTGDYLLEQIRDWLHRTAVDGCTLYRVADDEFALLLRGTTFEAARKRARAVAHRFTEPWQANRGGTLPLYCTVSLGLVFGEYIGRDIRNQLFRTVHSGGKKSTITIYDARMDKRVKHRFLIRQSLINCLQQGMEGFRLVYQPIVDPRTGVWRGAEALCRWNCPGVGWVPPTQFVADIEQLGLVDMLDSWVLETAISQCAELGLHKKEFTLDVNMSPLQMVDRKFVSSLLNILKRHAFPRDKLSLEITESSKFDFSHTNLAHLQNLRGSGIKIALDDFGTGYSSFENLMRLPAHVLKTEKSFIDHLEDDPYQQYLLRLMVDLAHTAHMQVIAEGVETPGQRDLLVDYGADYVQGYLYSRPLSAARLKTLVGRFADAPN